MMRSELLARALIVIGIGVTLVPFALRPGGRGLEVHGRMAESGGWTPVSLEAEVGRPLQISLTSDDVVHGFAVGKMQMEAVDVLPGQVTELTLNFDSPGTYTFYCTRWCGASHWRMRGTIEVRGAADNRAGDPETPKQEPLYVTLGLDIDAPHLASTVPDLAPVAAVGRGLADGTLPAMLLEPGYYRAHAPAQVYEDLRADPDLQHWSDAQTWDVVAFIWAYQVSRDELTEGRQLYAQNCAACHGEKGAGDGVFAADVTSLTTTSAPDVSGAASMRSNSPASFLDAENMLGASPALLQGKILRGGMGTGMPLWGSIFTDRQTWNLVAFLYTFQFKESLE